MIFKQDHLRTGENTNGEQDDEDSNSFMAVSESGELIEDSSDPQE